MIQVVQAFFLKLHALKELHALRGVCKPRTNPYSYQGHDKAIDIILQARDETHLPIDIVMDSTNLKIALDVMDVLRWVPETP